MPDHRDHRVGEQFKIAAPAILPASVDLRAGFPDAYDQGDLGSCHDDQTEVLTENGWQFFDKVSSEEKLATVCPVTNKLFFERPARLVRLPFQGEMICGRSQTMDFKVTPDHKMLVRKWDEGLRTLSSGYTFVDAKDLGWYSGLMNRVDYQGTDSSDTFVMPGVEHKHKPQRVERAFPMAMFLRLLGLYLAEGTLCKTGQKGSVSNRIQIAAVKDREKSFTRALFAELGINALELKDRFTFENKQIYKAFESFGLKSVKAPQKFVPAFVFRQSSDNIKEFLLGHFTGDGSETKGGSRSHYTSSPQLAEDLQRLIFLSGHESYIAVRPARTSVMKDGRVVTGRHSEHRVSVCEVKNLSIERASSISREYYEGDVFCAEVPTHHTLVTRRNRKILISGNCGGNAAAGVLQYARRKQGLPDWTPSRLMLYYDARSLEHSTRVDAGCSIRDVIKGAAKNGAAPETMWPYEVAKFAKRAPRPAYTEAKKHPALEYAAVEQTEIALKTVLAAGYPIIFGISVYDSFESDLVTKTGNVAMPKKTEQVLGGHAIDLVGYDDAKKLWLFRNSWGTSWGNAGCGTLPYAYVLNPGLASDLWVTRLTA